MNVFFGSGYMILMLACSLRRDSGAGSGQGEHENGTGGHTAEREEYIVAGVEETRSLTEAVGREVEQFPVSRSPQHGELVDRATPSPVCKPLAVDGDVVVVGTQFGAIRRFDGPGRWSLISPTSSEPCGLVVEGDRVYWTELGTLENGFRDGRVMSATLRGHDVAVVAESQFSPTSMVSGENGVYWLECGTGVLWKTVGATAVENVSTSTVDASRYPHGCPDRGIAADGGVVVWLHRATGDEGLRLSYAREDGRASGEVSRFEHGYGIPDGVALVDGFAYVSLFRVIDDDDKDAELLERVAVPGGERTKVWRGIPRFLGTGDGRVLWADSDGNVYTERRGGARMVGQLRRSLMHTGYAITEGSLVWSDGAQVVRAHW